jgi:DNA-binding CsgD family transcriptional regulator
MTPLVEGRAAFAAQSWGEAYRKLAEADDQTALEVDELEQLALAAFLSGRDKAVTDAWTRAHHEALRLGDPQRAARAGISILSGLIFRGDIPPGMGWLARVARVLSDCDRCAEHVWIDIWKAFPQMFGGDPTGAEPTFVMAVDEGEGFEDIDLVTMARVGVGMCRVMQGLTTEGVAHLDEAMVAVTAGEVSPMCSGIVYCSVIAACSQIFDVQRASKWTTELTRWCDSQPDLVPFRGNCLVHRCEIMTLHGAWSDAFRVAGEACDELSGPVTWDTLGSAYYQLGELQRLRGEYAKADESYGKASEAGRPPEPGIALLRLAQGRPDVATAVIRRVTDETEDSPSRSRMLRASVEIMLATGDVAAARAGADELARIAASLGAPYLSAVAAYAAGSVLLAAGDPRSALPKLRAAAAVWRDLDAPYETARVRVLIASGCRALGDAETADREVAGARATFEQLGATPDVERLDALTHPADRSVPGGLSPREVEVLRLVATGLTNRAIATELVLSERTVERHVSNIFAKIAVTSRSAATAYAYEHHMV